jgi:saccharopine dehydrogenase-like NADP-dependent oxidoreductase
MRTIVIIGGAGNMVQYAIKLLLGIYDTCNIILADFNNEKAVRIAESYRTPRVQSVYVDVYQPELLRKIIRGCDLVINGAGPYYRTGIPVLEACIDEKIDYIDMGDDDESALSLLNMDEAVRKAGITALICCGIAPGVVNVMARWLAQKIDTADAVEVAWVTGSGPDKDKKKEGAAVIEHMVHVSKGKCVTIVNGERVLIPSFRLGKIIDFPRPVGRYTVYQIGHAETATIPRFMPSVKRVCSMGSLHPAYLNGMFRGIGWLVEHGQIHMNDAVKAIMELDQGKQIRGFKINMAIIIGTLKQVLNREISFREFLMILKSKNESDDADASGAIMVAVEGIRNRKRLRLEVKYSAKLEMDEATGTPLSIFASILLDGHIKQKGVFAPEGCIDPKLLFERLQKYNPFIIDLINSFEERVIS